jgi:PAS domain S-box-containing protein
MVLTSGDKEQLGAELARLVVRRIRIGLGAIAAGVLVSMIGDHVLMPARPRWADEVDTFAIGLVGTAFWLLSRPRTRARPVPFALLIVAVTCGMRALSGIWFGDVVPTAILCAVVALTAAVTLPWGVWPQLVAVALAGAAITANAAVVGASLAGPPAHLIVAVFIALAVSVALSIELQHHYTRLFVDNLQRRRAEGTLNAELERRVAERTAELAATMQRLEDEVRERRQATHELHESQKRLQDILDNATAVIHLKDLDGRYLLVNRHWETVFGMRREDAVGKTPYDLFPADIADALRANDRAVLASREPLQVEEVQRPRGAPRTYLSVKFPLYDSDGAPVGVCGISTDITARKQMEAELRRSEASLSALVENTSEGIWSIDRTGAVQVMNSVTRRRYEERFGAPFDQAHPAPVPQPLLDEFTRFYARALAGERVQVERTYEEKDGLHYYLTSLHPIVENGVVTGATAFNMDITEHKRAEALARQHQAELAHVLRVGTIGEIAAGLAHEINQPLGAIANYAQGCARRLRTGASETALLPIIEEIAGEALRAGAIIRRLRDLVRKKSPPPERLDLNGLVRESARVIEPEARQFGIRVRLDLTPDLPPVTCDGIQIEQVLLNLLLNGIEAVQASGNGERTIAVTTAPLGDAAVEVAIRDSGVGLPAPPTDVFAPFFSTKPSGLGMGLSISRSIIEAHGGRLSAARNADRGSTFRFTLPMGGERPS